MEVYNSEGPAVIVDPYSSGAFYAPAFAKQGVPVIAVQTALTPPDVYATSYRPEDFQQILVAEGDLTQLVAKLKVLKPRCILTGCESGVELTDAIAPLVVKNVANDVSKSSARRHKGDMAKAIIQAGLAAIPQLCTRDKEKVRAWLEHEGLNGHDLVIKPPKSASTDGVTRIRQGEGWEEIFDGMLNTTNRLGLINDELVIQEYISGVEYVVDTVSYEGMHSVSDICRYTKIDNGNYMAIYDCMEWLPPTVPVYAELVNYTKSVLDAVGMRFGCAHVELMLTSSGPRLIEVGARPHGGGHPRFCRVATGDSQVDRMVSYFMGDRYIPPSFKLMQSVLVVFLICKQAGYVRNAEVLNQVSDLESYYDATIHIYNDDWLEPTKDLFASLDLGFVVLAHEDRQQVMQDYQQIRAIERQLNLVSSTISTMEV